MPTLSPTQRKLVAIPLAVIAGLLLLYAALGFFVVPRWLERELPQWSEARLGVRAQWRDVRFNPFLLALSARDVRIAMPDGHLLGRADSLAVDLQWSAVFTRSARIDALRLDGLDATILREADGRFVVPKSKRQTAQASPPTVRLPSMRIGVAAVHAGTVRFIDRMAQPAATSAITAIDLTLRDIATDTDRDGRMRLTALLPEGGAVAWTGRIGLQPIVAEGDLRLMDVRPIALWKHLHGVVPIGAPAGQFDLSTHYRFAYAQGTPQLTLRGLDIEGGGLTLAQADAKAPAMQLARLRVREGSFDLARRELILPRVGLHTGAVAVAVDEQGVLNWQRMFKRDGQDNLVAPSPAAAAASWQVRIGSLTLDNVDVDYSDRSRERPLHVHAKTVSGAARLSLAVGKPPARVDVRGVTLDIAELSLGGLTDAQPALRTTAVKLRDGRIDLATHEAQFPGVELGPGTLRFAVDRTGRLNWSALFARRPGAPEPPTQAPGWQIALTDLHANGLDAEYLDESRRRAMRTAVSALTGQLDLRIAGGTPSPVALDNLRVAGKALRVGASDARAKPLVNLAAVSVARGRMNGHDVLLSGLQFTDGALHVERAPDGDTDLGALLQPATAQSGDRRAAARNARAVDAKTQPWRIELPGLRLERVAVRYADRGRAEPLLVQSAALRAAANLHLVTGAAARADALSLRAAQLEIGALQSKARTIAIDTAIVERASLRAGLLELGRIDLAGGTLRLTRMADGSTDLQRLFVDRAPKAAPAPATPVARTAQQAWHVRSPDMRLRDFELRVDDRTRAKPVRVVAANTAAHLRFDFIAGERFAVRGLTAQSGPLTLADQSGARITGLSSARVEGGEIDSVAHRIAADTVVLRDGELVLERDASGRLMLLDTLGPAQPKALAAKTAVKNTASRPWDFRVNRLAIEAVRTRYVDRTFMPALELDLPLRQAVLTRLDPSAAQPAGLHAELGVGAAGHASLDGTLSQDLRRADATLVADGIDMKALQPVLGQRLALEIESGTLDARSAVRMRRDAGAAPVISTNGEVSLARLSIKESATGERFLGWRQLHAQPVIFTSQPRRLAVGQVLVQAPVAKLEIAQGGGLNLKHILKPAATPKGSSIPTAAGSALPASAQTDASSPPASAQVDASDQQGPAQADTSNQSVPAQADAQDAATPAEAIAPVQPPAIELRIDRLRLRDGTLRYVDQTLMLPFDVNIKGFAATFTSVSNMPGEAAQLRAEGRIEPFALATAQGSVELAAPKRFTDIRTRFLNVEMPKLSPYTITFAGRAIAEGRLWLDLETHIENGQLLGNNEVTVRNLRLGERVDAPRARDLPLDLAARLLTNEEGVISVQVPLSGDLTKPGFDYHGIIRKAIGNTLTRLATSPFRFVGRLFGLGSARVDRIAFEAGSAQLRPPEQEKLQSIAQALSEEPALHADLQPAVSRDQDLEAMRTERVRRELARRLGIHLLPGEDPGPTAFDQAATQRALEAMRAQRPAAGADATPTARAGAVDSEQGQREKSGSQPIGLGSGDRAFYEALFQRLVESQPLPGDALADLARRRAEAIASYLSQATEVSRARIRIARTTTAPPERDNDLVQSELRLRKR